MPHKTCPKCFKGGLGVRTLKCVCGYNFTSATSGKKANTKKVKAAKLTKAGKELSRQFRKVKPIDDIDKYEPLTNWQELKPGQAFRVLDGGLYYSKAVDKANAEIMEEMGYRGKFTVVEITKKGILASGNKAEGGLSFCFINMTEEWEDGNMLMVPYKLGRASLKLVREEQPEIVCQ